MKKRGRRRRKQGEHEEVQLLSFQVVSSLAYH
jgi:hypothetical protein